MKRPIIARIPIPIKFADSHHRFDSANSMIMCQ